MERDEGTGNIISFHFNSKLPSKATQEIMKTEIQTLHWQTHRTPVSQKFTLLRGSNTR